MIKISKSTYFNCHSHRKPAISNEFTIRNACLHVPKNAPLKYGLSVGIHPWHLNKIDWRIAKEKLISLMAEAQVFALGEVGLDRLKPNFVEQLDLLKQQLILAEPFQKPVIIHCVKAYSDLITFLKSSTLTFILHAYQGNLFQTNQLLKFQNTYFSFGESSLNSKERMDDILKIIPINRVLLETDTSKKNIEMVYRMMLERLEISEYDLKIQIRKNFEKVFFKTISSSYNPPAN